MKGSATSPTTPDPGTHPSGMPTSGNLLPNPSVALTAALSARDPILLTQRQFQILHNAGMLGNGGGLKPSAPSCNPHLSTQPTMNVFNQPKRRTTLSTPMYMKPSTMMALSNLHRSLASTSKGAAPK
ncbi:hypothetical protein OPQ81_003814 [Rhizoctonia solani]|nr:hypothetical protein OPQ81_003814 [Rhizoctonia solani]